MKRPGFLQGIGAAAALAVLSGIAITVGLLISSGPVVIRLLAPLLAICYLGFLLRGTSERTGRLTLMSAWLVASVAAWVLVPSLSNYLLIHAGMIWLVRSLYFYSGILPALLDAGLTILSAAAFAACVTRTGSIALSTWCFFLTQALFVFLPADLQRRKSSSIAVDNARFERARIQADNALRQLMS